MWALESMVRRHQSRWTFHLVRRMHDGEEEELFWDPTGGR